MKDTVRILLVDDMPSMRRLVTTFLHELGYLNVREATNGIDAFALLHKEAFDLVVTDWSMPGMTGLELLRAIRKEPDLQHLPVLLITAEARKENILAAAHSGASSYMVKPFTMVTLGKKIEGVLQRNQDDSVTAES